MASRTLCPAHSRLDALLSCCLAVLFRDRTRCCWTYCATESRRIFNPWVWQKPTHVNIMPARVVSCKW